MSRESVAVVVAMATVDAAPASTSSSAGVKSRPREAQVSAAWLVCYNSMIRCMYGINSGVLVLASGVGINCRASDVF